MVRISVVQGIDLTVSKTGWFTTLESAVQAESELEKVQFRSMQ